MARIRNWGWVPVLISLFYLPGSAQAQTQENVPLDSWVYPVLEELGARGVELDRWSQSRPYTRLEVYRALHGLNRKIELGQWVLSESEQLLLRRMEREFYKDEAWIQGDKPYAWRLRAFGQEKVRGTSEAGKGRVSGGGSLGLHYGQRASLVTGILVDQEAGKDPGYTGYRWNEMYGDFDAAYVQVAVGPARAFAGRGKLFWGPGRDESLILSGNAPALDRLGLDLGVGPWKFSWFAAELDPLKRYPRPDTPAVVEQARRLLVGHRLDVKLGHSLEFGASEAFVYGGPERTWELHFLNPLLLYHAVQLNDDSPGNTLFGFDGRWLIRPKWETYGEVMLDDWQIEHKTPQDEEPSHWGLQAGLRVADPLGLEGTYAWVNYTRVSNWVYNVYQPYERYIFKGKSLGWSGGNDGDALSFAGIKHLSTSWDVGAGFVQKRRGEGRPDGPWPFVVLDKDTLTKRGFRSEPFPSGVVERNTSGELYVRWQPSADAWIEAGIGAEGIKNEKNIQGNDRSSVTGRLLARCQLDWLVP